MTLFFGCTCSFLSLIFGATEVEGKTFYAGGSLGNWLGSMLSEYLNRTGSIIVLLTLIALSTVLSTQVSLGRMFSTATDGSKDLSARGVGRLRAWIDERRKRKQRQEVIAKHTKKAAAASLKDESEPVKALAADRDEEAPVRAAAAPAVVARKRAEPALPLSEPDEPKRQRKQGAYTLPPPSLLDAPKAEQKIDERELMDAARQLEEKCREFAVEGQVAQIHPGPVVTTFEFKPDAGVKYSKITSLADDLCLAMQAESVLIDRIPGKSTVGIQIPNPNRGADLAARAAGVGRLPALHVEAHAGARQDDPRRALRHRSRDDAAPADCRLHRHRQVGGAELDADQHPLSRDARRRAADHDRPETARARHVRGDPAPAHAGRRRSEEGGQRAALGRARDGRALQDAGGRRRAQHRAVQPQHPSRARRKRRQRGHARSRCPSSWS